MRDRLEGRGRGAKPAKVSAQDAAATVRSGDTVVLGSGPAEPHDVVQALCARASDLRDVTILSGILLNGYPFLDYPAEVFRFRSWYMPSTSTGLDLDPQRVECLPFSWSQLDTYLRSIPIDVVILQVAGPSAEGNYSTGTSISYLCAAMASASRVIAVVNPHVPYTFGDSEFPSESFDMLVEGDSPLPEFSARPADARDRVLARHVAETVDDGSLIQVGVGTLPEAVLSELARMGRRNLRQFSFLTDAYLELVDAGAMVGDGPSAIVGEIAGSRALYRHADRNPAIQMVGARGTHAIGSLLGQEKLCVLGAALEVDLFGQANLEVLGGAQLGGAGGAIDFQTAAAASATATSVVMLRAATSSGRSRIVPILDSGPVSLSRTIVGRVATEHGIADLTNLSVRERATALSELASPEDRPGLHNYIEEHRDVFCG